MEKDRGARITAIIALVIGVSGLSLGFAAFSNSLVINSSANVTTDPTEFSVDFSSVKTAIDTTLVEGNVSSTGGATGDYENVVIDNSSVTSPSISNLVANFTRPGQTVTYTFYAINNGLYDAYLKSLNASVVPNTDKYIECKAATDSSADSTLIENACKTISVSVKVDGVDPLLISGNTGLTGNTDSINNHVLARNESTRVGGVDTVTVTITYAEGAQRVDGNFDVTFGKVSLGYSSVN